MPDLYGEMVENRPGGSSYFLLAGSFFLRIFHLYAATQKGTARNGPRGYSFIKLPKLSSLLYRHCQQGLSNSLWAFLKELPIPFRCCSTGLLYRVQQYFSGQLLVIRKMCHCKQLFFIFLDKTGLSKPITSNVSMQTHCSRINAKAWSTDISGKLNYRLHPSRSIPPLMCP